MRNTRGIRNNNPLNIRAVPGTRWLGQTGTDRDGFVVFESAEWGFRAAMRLLRTYAAKHKCATPCAIVARWAPPSENATGSYTRQVCALTGFGGNQSLTPADWPRLLRAMARVETGADYGEVTIARALQLYRESDGGEGLTSDEEA